MRFIPSLKGGTSLVALMAGMGLFAGANSAQAGVQIFDTIDCNGTQVPFNGLNRQSFILDSLDNGFYGYTVCNTSDPFGPDPLAGDEEQEGSFLAIRDWELPFFGTSLDNDNIAGINGITSPYGWTFAIEEIGVENRDTGWDGVAVWQQEGDPFREFFDDFFAVQGLKNPYNSPDDDGVVTHVLHWYTNPCGFFNGEGLSAPEGKCVIPGFDGFDDDNPNQIDPDEFWEDTFQTTGFFANLIEPGLFGEFPNFLDGFGFFSDVGASQAPYQASWIDFIVNTGDPLFPLGQDSGGLPDPVELGLTTSLDAPDSVFEPASIGILGVGLAGLAGIARRRRKTPA